MCPTLFMIILYSVRSNCLVFSLSFSLFILYFVPNSCSCTCPLQVLHIFHGTIFCPERYLYTSPYHVLLFYKIVYSVPNRCPRPYQVIYMSGHCILSQRVVFRLILIMFSCSITLYSVPSRCPCPYQLLYIHCILTQTIVLTLILIMFSYSLNCFLSQADVLAHITFSIFQDTVCFLTLLTEKSCHTMDLSKHISP